MDLSPASRTFISLVDTAGPAIARVEAPRQPGVTGLLWSDDGIVITAHHALRRDEPIKVGLGEHEPQEARLLGRDPATDLAVLRVAQATAMSAPTWRNPGTLRVGELGLALARPGRSVRAALALLSVVGDRLRTPGGRELAPYIELDRALPRGFPAAPVLDDEGQILGLATSGLAPEATILLSKATVARTVAAIVAHGRVPQGYLGVGVSAARLPATLHESLGQRRALVVVGLAEDGPAARAGLQVGDLILTVEGNPVRSPAGLRAQLAERAGEAVALGLLRGGEATALEVEATDRR